MSGIVGSSHNIRGSGIVAKLGTDGQVFTSAGAGLSQTFEDAAGGGKVLQVVSASDSTSRTTTSNSFAVNSNTLQLDITPAATSSKILIICDPSSYNATGKWGLTVFRDSTQLGDATYGLAWALNTAGHNVGSCHILDSPSSTSAITYGVQFRSETCGVTTEINYNGATSVITALEIGA